ncbi:MAG: hypothetical protein KC468_16220, partial [Myxococcales bacterium]|nr:hypothetical protein [Myxococcales bacterium]
RGEALRLLGRVDEAIVDLEQAIRARPRRISAIINLALARRERGELAATRARFLELATRVPGLMSDATRECGRRLYAPTPAALTDDDIQRILARALVMLRGNRGSTLLTYFTGEGRLRLAPIFDRDAIRPEALEREDHELIERLLDQAYGVAKGKKRRAVYRPGQPQQTRSAPAPAPAPTRERPPPHRPTTLTPEELEHFIARGYVTIRDGFARARAQAWVDDSIQRVRDDPARWVKMYLPGDPSRDLRGFDPARPETWTWARMDVEGRLRAPIAEFAPRVWGAICDLLGGPERVRTREWTNYFAVNVKGGEGRPWAPPTLDAPSWHFDDPSVDTRFETYRHGLIVLSYFSDVAPRGGGTYVAPESVAIAARELAAHPDGMNWLDRTVGPRILERCSEFVELTGPVGTVTLCHPFMLHSASTNAAGVVRFLGNTVIDMTEPFNLQRDDPAYYTPVERALLRALGRPER